MDTPNRATPAIRPPCYDFIKVTQLIPPVKTAGRIKACAVREKHPPGDYLDKAGVVCYLYSRTAPNSS